MSNDKSAAPVTLRSGREPFEVALLTAITLYGIAATIAFDKFGVTTLKSFPEPWGRVFIAAFGAGALVALVGVLLNSLTGVLVERIGLWLVSGLGIAFALWSLGTVGARALAFVLLVLGVALASVVRLRQIHRQQKITSTAARLVMDEEEGEG